MGKIKKKQTKFQMTDFCDFVPDDPSCQVDPPTPEPGPDGGDGPVDDIKDDIKDDVKDDMKDEKMMEKDDKEMTWEKYDEMASEYFHPMEANLAYLGVAAGALSEIVLNRFVWHESNASTLSQAASGSGNTDYYDLLHMVGDYGGLGVWGIAAFTQLLATMGIMVGINMMVWGAYMASSDEEKAKFREDKEFLMMLRLTPEMVEDWGKEGDEKMEKDGKMKPMDKLLVRPSSLRTAISI